MDDVKLSWSVWKPNPSAGVVYGMGLGNASLSPSQVGATLGNPPFRKGLLNWETELGSVLLARSMQGEGLICMYE